jgi:hypothetical protein
VKFFGRTGGIVPSPEEVTEQLTNLLGKAKTRKTGAKAKAVKKGTAGQKARKKTKAKKS